MDYTTYTNDENLDFLEKKIKEIRVAMFRAESDALLCLPNNIITTLKTDKDGNIWFLTSCNKKYAKNVDKCFYATLDYYQKGTECRLRISGSASIVEDIMEVTDRSVDMSSNIFMIKLKIMNAEYIETRHVHSTFKDQVKGLFHRMFLAPDYRQFHFPKTV